MKMLTVAARARLDQFAKEHDLHSGDALNVLLEVVVPELDPDTVSGWIATGSTAWMRLEIGEHCEVDVPLGEEPAFRARIARYRKNTGRTITVQKIKPEWFVLTRHVELPSA